MIRHLLLGTACGALTACTAAEGVPPATASSASAGATATAAVNPSEALKQLFAQSDEASLKRNPVGALYRGDMRYADQLGDYITDDYYAAERASDGSELPALGRIDRAALSADEQVSYDTFKWQRTIDLRGVQPDLLALTAVRPIDHMNGFHTFFAQISAGDSVAPYKTVADYENGLKRTADFVRYADNAIGRMREGLASGVVQPRLVMENVVQQLDMMIGEGVEGSSFYRPVANFPSEVPAADQARLRAAYAQSIRTDIMPALTRLRDFIRTDYLPRARASVGLSEMKGGPELYRYLVEQQTTTTMAPDEIHMIGLRQVEMFHAEMEKVKAQVGFNGTLKQFFEHIRTDPKFKPQSREWLQREYVAIGKRVDANIGKLFATVPKSGLEIRPVPALTEKGAARGSYNSGTPDGSRPGIFYFNAYDLPSRTTPSMVTLYLHEGAPGHHFQISLAQENVALPSFQRFGGNNAYVEGWGLYSETLGKELGVLEDPYQYFGFLDSQLFRAIRLVVDTGIHTKGWTRDQSIQYILDNSSRGRANATAETERYIANPGQALGYKLGMLKILELRERAKTQLGDKFDLKEFHKVVLGSGSLPLPV
ncbi:MAG: DUF885 domain-containing protein, partial [Sphingomonadaceae bacterium]|nr:DUF885 domain-containing protein [Sphingomonadaceae bacterium]